MTATAEEEHTNTSHDHHHHHSGRRLFGAPKLMQDWDQQSNEGAVHYWELFLDLLLVAAASSVADQFKDNLTLHGFGEFAVFYAILINGWLLYTHHITTRLEDASLVHSMVFFVYSVGFGFCTVNTGYADVQAFCWGAVLLRASILAMLASFALCIPRARYFCTTMALVAGVTMVGLLVVAIWGASIEESPLIMAVFWISAGFEFAWEILVVTPFVDLRRFVPINIEHTKERLGALELVMLGETILSVCMIYREMVSESDSITSSSDSGSNGKGDDDDEQDEATTKLKDGSYQHPYYWVLTFSFLLIFMFLLLFFHLQPDPEDHAFRRSSLRGTVLLLIYKVLGLTFLAVGTSVKLVVECLLLQEEMPVFVSQLMGYGVGCSLVMLLIMRVIHYGGIESVNFGGQVYHVGTNPAVDRMMSLWWGTFSVAAVLPFVGVLTGITLHHDPLVLTCVHALLLFLLCVVESYYSHAIQDSILSSRPHGSTALQAGIEREKDSLLSHPNNKATTYT